MLVAFLFQQMVCVILGAMVGVEQVAAACECVDTTSNQGECLECCYAIQDNQLYYECRDKCYRKIW